MIFYIQINTKLSYNLIPLFLVGIARPAQIAKNKFTKSFQYLKKEVRMKLIYCAMSITVFYKLKLSFLMDVFRLAWSAQYNKLAASLQYLRKELSYEVDVLHIYINMKIFCKLIILFWRVWSQYSDKFAISV